MGVEPNASNTPDLYGYEMKNHSNSVVTLGSWDPNYWIFRNEQYDITRDDFLKIFGKPNPLKNDTNFEPKQNAIKKNTKTKKKSELKLQG